MSSKSINTGSLGVLGIPNGESPLELMGNMALPDITIKCDAPFGMQHLEWQKTISKTLEPFVPSFF